jgi:hypothetical protein
LRVRWAILFAAILAIALATAPAALAAAPTVTNVNPGHGPAAGGTSVTISGSDFSGATEVDFGVGNPATDFTVVSDSSITATAPAGTGGGTVDVTVTADGTSDPGGNENNYSYDVPRPTITALNPTHGPAAGGNQVTISGTNLIGTTGVDFGGVGATNVNVVNSSTVTATAPGHTGNAMVNVHVTTPGGTSSGGGNDYFYDPPSVAGLTPNHGPGGGGYLDTIVGTEYSGATAVRFGSANSSSVNVINDSTITVNAPSGAAGSTVDVTVVTPNGTSPVAGTANDFSYDPVLPPTITVLAPARGPSTGGNQVTITGTGFAGATTVKFGAVKAAFLVLNNGTITATAPAGTGKVDVTVTTAVGTNPASGAGNDYSYDPVLLAAGPRTPNTFIDRHPHHRIHKRKVAFTFSSDVTGVTYKCLYAAGWTKCHSPLTFRHLRPGRYRFKVEAVVNGVADPTPATFTFRVRR